MAEIPTPAPPPLPFPREERLHALDHLRAVAMLLGIYLHAAISFMTIPVPWVVRDAQPSAFFDVTVSLIHGFRMQLFFLLAGFFARLLHQRAGTAGFLKQRFTRIGVPFGVGMVTLIPAILGLWAWAAPDNLRELARGAGAQEKGLRAWPTGHLWFLQYLLVYYALVGVLARPLARLASSNFATLTDRGFGALVRSFWKPLLLVWLTMPWLFGGPMIGEVEQAGQGLLPGWKGLGYYGVYFAFGWLLHRRKELLGELDRFWPWYLGVGFVAWLGKGIAFMIQHQAGANSSGTAILLLGNLCSELYCWCLVFAFTGLFLRYFPGHRPWARYLADASYWFYLLHLPPVLWLQVVVAPWPINPLAKFALVNAVTVLFLLASYHWCVRHTAIGRLLNGPRQRPTITSEVAR